MILCRLNSSSYMEPDFILQESNLAHVLGLDYCNGLDDVDLSSRKEIILITNTHSDVSSLSTELLSRVKLLIHPNSGHDNLPYEWVNKQSFPILLGNNIRAHAVTNTILSHLFGHYSPLGHQEAWDKERLYKRKLLSELTVHIIGHGHIGVILEQSLTPLVKKLHITDINNSEELSSDVIIPVPSLTKSSRHLINESFLLNQADDFCLINCSRGEVVNTKELLKVLSQKKDAFAYLDVFEKEPCDFSEFSSYPNIKTTSHIAGVFKHIARDTIEFEKNILETFLDLESDQFKERFKDSLLNNKTLRDFP